MKVIKIEIISICIVMHFLVIDLFAQEMETLVAEKQVLLKKFHQSLTFEQDRKLRAIMVEYQSQMKALFDDFIALAPEPEDIGRLQGGPGTQPLISVKKLMNGVESGLREILEPDQLQLLHQGMRVEGSKDISIKGKTNIKNDENVETIPCNVSDCYYSPYYQEWARYANELGYSYAYLHYLANPSSSDAYLAYYYGIVASYYIKTFMKYAGPTFFAVTYIGNIAYEDNQCYTSIAFYYAELALNNARYVDEYAQRAYKTTRTNDAYYSYLLNNYALKYADYARNYAFYCQNCCNN
uniref:Uncharacterized protein n=1 Tax=Desulfatirhabdium butyrativorans TaxID=340467 RepID=A0A7C4RLS9_9BACT